MKTTTSIPASFRTNFVCLLLLTMPPIALAADENIPPNAASPETRSASKSYALEISGGTFLHKGQKSEANLTTLVDALRDLYPKVNIALAPEVARTRIPDLKLHFTQIEDTLEALRVASGYRFTWRRGNGSAGEVDPATGLPKPGGSQLYVLDMGIEPPPPRKRLVEVFNLSGYLQQQGKRDTKDVQDNLTQIEDIVVDTLNMLNKDESVNEAYPSFRFHPGASLLIVAGSPEAIDVARKVLTALPGLTPGLVTPNPRPAGLPEGVTAEQLQTERERFMKRYGLSTMPGTQPTPAPQR
jgi:hypothetical protein